MTASAAEEHLSQARFNRQRIGKLSACFWYWEEIQMIRVTRTEERSRTRITVDGELSADSIAVVETCCRQAEWDGKPVQLFLRDVTRIDQAGRMLISRLAASGVRLAATGVYTAYLVQELTADGDGLRNDPMTMYQHDSPLTYRFVLRGELAGERVEELEHAWNTAKSILGGKELVVDVSGITDADHSGVVSWLVCASREPA